MKILGDFNQELLSDGASIIVDMGFLSIFVLHSDLRQKLINLTILFRVISIFLFFIAVYSQ